MRSEVSSWLETTALQLLDGQRLLLRLPPRVGKSYLIGELATVLGSSAVVVDGASFTEENQLAKRADLEEQIITAVRLGGSAQVLFDSYDRALRRSHGARLQSWLTHALIDGDIGQDCGALFTARCGSQVTRPGAGSPLMSRVTPTSPPTAAIPATEAASPVNEASWFGDSALLTGQASSRGSFEPVSLADRLSLDTTYINEIRAVAAAEVAAEAIIPLTATYETRCAIQGLLTESGPTLLFERLRPLLTAPTTDGTPGWPPDWQASVKRFAELLGNADQILWVDRYMYRDIRPLYRFLRDVLTHVDCEIRLLGASRLGDREISLPEMATLNAISAVDARWMTGTQFRLLHDRHLVIGAGGWVVPQVHVMIGKQDPGSTVASPTSAFGVDYSCVWREANRPTRQA